MSALNVTCSGENIEPQPIEDAVCESRFIKFCTVVGNDCKHLGALLVPDMDALSESHPGVHNLTKGALLHRGNAFHGLRMLCVQHVTCPADRTGVNCTLSMFDMMSRCFVTDTTTARDNVAAILRREVTKATAARTSREHIRQIAVLDEPYSVEDGTLTRTMKPRRPAIADRYADIIADLKSRLQ